jgi:hypothetical protein
MKSKIKIAKEYLKAGESLENKVARCINDELAAKQRVFKRGQYGQQIFRKYTKKEDVDEEIPTVQDEDPSDCFGGRK